MILMGMDKEAAEAQQDIDKQLSFDQDIDVKNFEITIRCLGGPAQRIRGHQRSAVS